MAEGERDACCRGVMEAFGWRRMADPDGPAGWPGRMAGPDGNEFDIDVLPAG